MENKDSKNWVDWCNRNIVNHPYNTSGAKTQAELNKRFYHGDQYQKIDEVTGLIRKVNIKRDTKAQYNFIQVSGKAFSSKMYAEDPVPQAEPPSWSASYSDVEVCDVANAILQYFWDKLNMRKVGRACTVDGYQTGWGWTRIQLERGEKIAEVEGMLSDKQIEGMGEIAESFYDSSISAVRCDPLNIYPDPLATCQDEMRWVIYEWIAYRSELAEMFGVDRDDIPESKTRDESSGIEEKRASEESESLLLGEGVNSHTVVRELYHMPCTEYPDGAHVFVIGDKEFDAFKLPGFNTRVERMKYFVVPVNPNEDRLRGDGYVEMQLPAQRAVNKAKSQIEESLRMSVAKWIVETNSNVSKITDAFDVVKYTNTGNTPAPHQSQVSPLPANLMGLPDANMNLVKFITGMADPNFGQIPMRGSQTSGTVIRELKDATAQLHAADIGEHKVWQSNIAREILLLVQKNFDKEQILRIVGSDKESAVDLFLSEKTDWVKGYGIVIRIGEGFGNSASSRFDEFKSLAQLGPDYMPPQMLFQAYGNYFSWSEFLKPFTNDKKTARSILNSILASENVEDLMSLVQLHFSPHDNHEVHLQVFTEWMRSTERFAMLGKPFGPEKLVEINKYMDLCKQSLAQQMAPPAPPQQAGSPVDPQQAMQAEDNMRMANGQPVMAEGV
jgi:hypothetical protein